MNSPRPPRRANAIDRLGLNPWLQVFLTIIAGAAVAVIVWDIIQRFLNIITLLIASLLLAYLLNPLVERLQRGGVRRPLAILLVYLTLFSIIALAFVLLLGPLTVQLSNLLAKLPSLLGGKSGQPSTIDTFFKQHGIKLTMEGIRTQLAGYISTAAATLLGSTLAIVTGIVTTITDLLLILAITFYLLLDGHAMRNRAVRLLPASYRERWFFFEATIDKVLGGYVRGQLLVALTVGTAAGVGCWALGVHYQLVIGLLAFLFELVPMIGPVLGMVPAVAIALFQSPGLALWVVVYFVIMQQIESNVIVPRVSGHAVGLHPLAALLALLVGVELGGLGGALLSVPLAGVLWVVLIALYGDVTGQTQMIGPRPRQSTYFSRARQMIDRRRPTRTAAPVAADVETSTPVAVGGNERLAAIKQEQEHLIEQFEANEAEQSAGAGESNGFLKPKRASKAHGPDDPVAPEAV